MNCAVVEVPVTQSRTVAHVVTGVIVPVTPDRTVAPVTCAVVLAHLTPARTIAHEACAVEVALTNQDKTGAPVFLCCGSRTYISS